MTAGNNASPSCQSPEECFSLFLSDDVWQFLVDSTNEYARKKINEMQVRQAAINKHHIFTIIIIDDSMLLVQ